MPDVVYVALGSNMGDRAGNLATARDSIGRLPGTDILGESTIDETEPIGPQGQGAYLNQMLAVSTRMEPHTLLAALHRIENAAGRTREVKWGPRTLDLDIVLIEGREIQDELLTVPHPELPNRDFWLQHLNELRGRSNG
jgi:2-amino-4-hydroxy-6-hydroxymethyldihydropteridine diphosphokinase